MRYRSFARIGLSAALLALLVMSGAGSARAQFSVYLMGGGNAASDAAVANTLSSGGFNVTIGVDTPSWTGAQANLQDYNAVLVLNNYNWRGQMSESGALALRDYVTGGGGLITGEWLSYNAPSNSTLAALLPTSYYGFTDASSLITTYIQVTTDTVLNAGMPGSFTFTKGDAEGTEGRLTPKSGASLFYQSSATGAAGLAGWNYGAGKVMSFSSVLTGTDVNDPNLSQLLRNSVRWAGTTGPTPAHAPEGGSIAMLIGGALPLGLVLRTRLTARKPGRR